MRGLFLLNRPNTCSLRQTKFETVHNLRNLHNLPTWFCKHYLFKKQISSFFDAIKT